MRLLKVTDRNFGALVERNTVPVLVEFWAPWCGPCRQLTPMLERMAGVLGEKVLVVKMNVDDNQETGVRFGIQSVPTLLLFRGGDVSWSHSGTISQPELLSVLKNEVPGLTH